MRGDLLQEFLKVFCQKYAKHNNEPCLKKTCRLAKHCKVIWIYVLPEKELRGLSPNFHIHVSVSDLFIPTIDTSIFLQQNRQTDCGNI